MAEPRVLIMRAAGTNCDEELAFAFAKAGGRAEKIHVNRLVEGSVKLSDYEILGLPGGFTYGDDIAAGRVLGNELTTRLKDDLFDFVESGKPVIGICNGFQVLVNTGLLPGAGGDGKPLRATLTNNDSGRFEDRWTLLEVGDTDCFWTRGLAGETVFFPVAHAEGKFVCESDETLRKLRANRQVVFCYAAPGGGEPAYPHNPNGSQAHIAGICNIAGNVLGLMPHPERHVTKFQRPDWTASPEAGEDGDGLRLFANAVEFVS